LPTHPLKIVKIYHIFLELKLTTVAYVHESSVGGGRQDVNGRVPGGAEKELQEKQMELHFVHSKIHPANYCFMYSKCTEAFYAFWL
jgi:hypothetical protein